MPTAPSGFTAMPSCGGSPRANSTAGATAKGMWGPAQRTNWSWELYTGTYAAPSMSMVGRFRVALSGEPPPGSGTHTRLRPSTSRSLLPAEGLPREAARVSSSSLAGQPAASDPPPSTPSTAAPGPPAWVPPPYAPSP